MCFKCSPLKQEYSELKTKYSLKKLELNVKNIDFSEEKYISNISNNFSAYTKNDSSYILAQNSANGFIEIYNLENQHRICYLDHLDSTVIKPSLGPVSSILFHNFDSIFIAQDEALLLIDSSSFIKSISINESQSSRDEHYFYRNLDHFPIKYDKINDGILIETYSTRYNPHNPKYYKQPIESIINLGDGKATNYNIGFPGLYYNNYFGFANIKSRATANNFSYYSFFADPNIYKYNRNNSKLEIFGGKSIHHTTVNPELSKKYKYNNTEKIRHLQQVNGYSEILLDPYRDLVYRFFRPAIPLKNKDGTYNVYGDKESYIMVFDKNFSLIDEIKLDKYYYNIHKSFVTPNGLYIKKYLNDTESHQYMQYDIFQFNIK